MEHIMRDHIYNPIHTNPLRGLSPELLERYRLLSKASQARFIQALQTIEEMPLGWGQKEYDKLIKVFFPESK
jgi:hypothetical protein